MPILNDQIMKRYLILRSDLGTIDLSKVIHHYKCTFFGYRMVKGCSLDKIRDLLRWGFFFYSPRALDVVCSTVDIQETQLLPFISRQKFSLNNKVYYLLCDKFYIPEQYVKEISEEEAYSMAVTSWINFDPHIDPSFDYITDFRLSLLNGIKYLLNRDYLRSQVMYELVSEIYQSKIHLLEFDFKDDKFILSITCTHPSKVIGKGGSRVDALKSLLSYHIEKYYPGKEISINLDEFDPLKLHPSFPVIRI